MRSKFHSGFFLLLTSMFGCDPDESIPLDRNMPSNTSILVFTRDSKADSCCYKGTASIIKYKEQFFLTSNYHVMVGRSWHDTSRFEPGFTNEPDLIYVYLRPKFGSIPAIDTLSLRKDSLRLFLSTPANDSCKT